MESGPGSLWNPKVYDLEITNWIQHHLNLHVFLQNGDEAGPQLRPTPTADISAAIVSPLMISLLSCFLSNPNHPPGLILSFFTPF